ncbi:MAG: spore germination protein GerW family protein [Bacillota bacterium]|nr:spore germination protein GerW family protein [Bacillota bacterium]
MQGTSTQNTADFTANMDTLISDLHNFAKSDSVLGAPLTVGDKTLVPLMSVTFGYGTTGSSGKAPAGAGSNVSMGGIGLGARVSANSVVVIDKNSVQVLPTNEKTNMGQMMDKIPQALSSMGQSMMGGGAQGQQQGGAQGQQNAGQSQQSGQQSSQKG